MRANFGTLLFAFAALLTLAACGEREDAPGANAKPPLYEIATADGETVGWLLGTVHALPDGIEWRTEPVERVIDQADYLILEVAELDNQRAIATIFGELASTEGLGPLSQRVDPELREPLAQIVARSDLPGNSFENTESWAAALMLARVDAFGEASNGVDRGLIRDFTGRKIIGFETAEGQLRIFDALAEADQRDLLEGTVREWVAARQNPGRLAQAYINGDIATLESATSEGIMADPELREALLVGRNRAWSGPLLTMLGARERPLVAVGAAHLLGPQGLIAMLEQNGYTVTRIE